MSTELGQTGPNQTGPNQTGPSQTSSRDALARKKLLALLAGSWVAQGVYAVVKLGIPELLAPGPRSAAELSRQCQADRLALTRLLRALTQAGLFTQPEPDTFGLTATAELLRRDVPGSVALNALMQGEEIFHSFAEIMHTLRTGRPSFEMVYGKPFYDYLGDHPEAAHTFHESMGNQGVPAALCSYPLADACIVVDLGGGNGSLLVELLSSHPSVRGVLVELPDAVRAARLAFAAAGLSGTGSAERVECVEASFFDHVPGGGDVYVLSRVLHNWADERAASLLRRVHAAMTPGARLLVYEEFVPEAGPAGLRTGGGIVDLLMLVTLEGRDRTEAEYRSLLVAGGFAEDAVRTVAEDLLEATRT